MKKLIVTLALAASLFPAAEAAASDPGSNVCERLRHAIATGTPISELPPRLLRRCFGHGSNVCRRLRHAIATGTPISELPPRLLRRCFGHDEPDPPTTEVTAARPAAVAPVAVVPSPGG